MLFFHRPLLDLGLVLLLAVPVVAPGSEPTSKPRLIPRPVPGLPALPERTEATRSASQPTPRYNPGTAAPKNMALPQSAQARILHIQRANAVVPKPPAPASKTPNPEPSSASLLIVNPQGQGSPVRVMSQAEAERLIQERSASSAK